MFLIWCAQLAARLNTQTHRHLKYVFYFILFYHNGFPIERQKAKIFRSGIFVVLSRLFFFFFKSLAEGS